MQLSEQEIIRRDKLNALRELGINPYPADLFPVNHTSKQVKENFEEGKKVILAGRLMSVRDQGKASFAELQDSEGRIQLYFNRDVLCEGEDKTLYNQVFKKLTDLGDFVGIEGELFMTKVYSLQITDIQGRITFFNSKLKEETNQIRSFLNKGVYIVVITFDNQTILRKRIVII